MKQDNTSILHRLLHSWSLQVLLENFLGFTDDPGDFVQISPPNHSICSGKMAQ